MTSDETLFYLKSQHSNGELHRLQPKGSYSPTQDTPVFLLNDDANEESNNVSSYTEEYVFVPAQFPSKTSSPPPRPPQMAGFHNAQVTLAQGAWLFLLYCLVGEDTSEVETASLIGGFLSYSGWVLASQCVMNK